MPLCPPCCRSHLWLETSAKTFAKIRSRLRTGVNLDPDQPFSGKLVFCSLWKLIIEQEEALCNILHFTLI